MPEPTMSEPTPATGAPGGAPGGATGGATGGVRWVDGFAARLGAYGALRASGDEAAKFLHGQLSNDVEHLGPAEARLFGYCSAKGRLFASFVGWRDGDSIVLATSSELIEPLRKRLSMFVLRTKARVTDASDEIVLFGLGGARAADAIAALGVDAPAPMTVVRAGEVTLIGLPGARVDGNGADADADADAERGARLVPRWLAACPCDGAAALEAALGETLARVDDDDWRWSEVRAGIARVVARTSEFFLPQSLNLELVGGVSFTKGCYPGQEVVARLHYRGTVKRRTFAGHVDAAAPEPGSDVFGGSGVEPCGQVVLSAPAPDGGADLLFECPSSMLEAGALRAGDAPIALLPLPYDVPG